jgi:hypothetical protein
LPSPIFSAPGLSPRPLYFSEAVMDELFGPPIVGSREREEWETRIAEMPPPREDPKS